jgi:hypothetical protein
MIKVILIILIYLIIALLNCAAMILDPEKIALHNVPSWSVEQMFKMIVYYSTFLIMLFAFFMALYGVRKIHIGVAKEYKKNLGYSIILYTMLTKVVIMLLFAFDYGLLLFIIDTRFNNIPVGGLNYIVLISMPIVLIQFINSGGNFKIAIIFFILTSFYSLLTGFRVLFIWSLIVISFFYFKEIKKTLSLKNFLLGIFTTLSLFFAFEHYREQLEGLELALEDKSILLSLNRSNPISTMILAENKGISPDFIHILYLILQPLIDITRFFINIELPDYGRKQLEFIEPLARDFLIWRGTPQSDASGISIHLISYIYILGGWPLIFIAGCLFGIFIYLAEYLVNQIGINKQILGALLFTLILCGIESFSVVWGLFAYSILFLFVSYIFSELINLILPKKYFIR